MKNKTHIRTRACHALWLTIAFCCVFFSGAIKKVMQLKAEQQISAIIPTDFDAARYNTQTLKDGYREKHEVQTIVLAENKQIPCGDLDPFLNPCRVSSLYSVYTWVSCKVSYGSHEAAKTGAVPEYLLLSRLNV